MIGAVTTRSGRVVRPLAPDDATVDLGDVAHHLSLVCRFGGACSRHYSVAQHCVLVSRVVPATHALAGLLHDAAEAYIGDVVSGLKRLPEYAFLRRAEGRLLAAVCRAAVGRRAAPSLLRRCLSGEVHAADRLVYAAEARAFGAGDACARALGELVPLKVVPWSPGAARRRYLKRLEEVLPWPVG